MTQWRLLSPAPDLPETSNLFIFYHFFLCWGPDNTMICFRLCLTCNIVKVMKLDDCGCPDVGSLPTPLSFFLSVFLCSPPISGLPVLAELTQQILKLFFFITELFIFLDERFILILNFLREILELFLSFFQLSLVEFVFVLKLFPEVLH